MFTKDLKKKWEILTLRYQTLDFITTTTTKSIKGGGGGGEEEG